MAYQMKCPECGAISHSAYDGGRCPSCGAELGPEDKCPQPKKNGGHQGNRKKPVLMRRPPLHKWQPPK